MKIVKWALIGVIFISALFEIVAGLWMMIDLESAASLLLALESEVGIVDLFGFKILANIAGKSFLMLSVYSLITCFFLIRGNKAGFLLSIATGLMISIIAITTYIDTASYMVWITDFSRGFLIVLGSLIYRKKLISSAEDEYPGKGGNHGN